MLAGKKILLGITGSIASYKSIFLTRLLIKKGAEVQVIMTPSAKDFVSPLVLNTLSKKEVLIELIQEQNWNNHVQLGNWANCMLIAPLSCNTLSKMVAAQCDNLLLAVYLSATCPIIAAPAMDADMWHHPATQKNVQTFQSFPNHHIINVQYGELASGLIGEGRMAEPEEIVQYLETFFALKENSALKNKKVLITAGPTYEAIDPVRFIGNHSSGKMGYALAEAFYSLGAQVTLVSGPTHISLNNTSIKKIPVTSAEEMFTACAAAYQEADIIVMAAAVADYTPQQIASEKIKKEASHWSLALQKTKDILQYIGAHKKPQQILVGFALETEHEKENALKKLQTKNADMMVLNSLRDEQAGFGYDTNKVTIFDKEGNEWKSPLTSKQNVAEFIIQTIIQKFYASAQ